MYAEERQQAMAHLISRRGRLSVVQLAEQFEPSRTARREIDHGRRILVGDAVIRGGRGGVR